MHCERKNSCDLLYWGTSFIGAVWNQTAMAMAANEEHEAQNVAPVLHKTLTNSTSQQYFFLLVIICKLLRLCTTQWAMNTDGNAETTPTEYTVHMTMTGRVKPLTWNEWALELNPTSRITAFPASVDAGLP